MRVLHLVPAAAVLLIVSVLIAPSTKLSVPWPVVPPLPPVMVKLAAPELPTV